MAYRRLKAGESPSEISASAYNSMLQLVEQRQGPAAGAAGHAPSASPYLAASVLNDTGLELPEFAIVRLDSPGIDPSVNLAGFQRRYVLRGKLPTEHCEFAVMLAPSQNADMRAAVVAGVTPITIDVVDESHDRAYAITDPARLRSGFVGHAQILWKEGGTGDKRALIRWPILPQRRMLGMTAATIAAGGSGTVNLSGINSEGNSITLGSVTAHLTWMHGGQAVSANRSCVVEWFPEHRRWIITGAECED
jgi:hypothetical protein